MVGPFEGDRISYELAELVESDVDPDPIVQLRRWLDDADRAGVLEPTGMTLSTVDATGRVTSRTVLLRQLGERGPVFFTNYDSDKGAALAQNPRCAAQLWWGPLQRQVRIEGRAHRLSEHDSDAYFATRPRGSQIGAWASPQSRPIADRGELDALVDAAEARFAETDVVPRPPHWGGYELVADRIEFWQGRPSRLHDRLRFDAHPTGWTRSRLAP
ncbi:MAG: pyridoxamine 5'-phosphate oxidase [Actinobacteria bacterium]|nr:pyridoxamine 5'-phosphate oxidase [Actinomycetota bacterium]